MNRLWMVLTIGALIGATLPSHAQDALKMERLTTKLDSLHEEVARIKRDQLNYRVEKDVIKEVSS